MSLQDQRACVRALCFAFDLLLCYNYGVGSRDLLETLGALAGYFVYVIARKSGWWFVLSTFHDLLSFFLLSWSVIECPLVQ